MLKKTKILCVLDGFGLRADSDNNAAARAHMPAIRSLFNKYYWTTLDADGDNVGQETGLVGNSEVGHMNLGGLQLVKQLSYQITKSSEKAFDKSTDYPDQLFDPKELLQNYWSASTFSKTVHLWGLFSTGQIHSDMRHWYGAAIAAHSSGAEKIIFHLITDGRDSDRRSLLATWSEFVEYFEGSEDIINKLWLGSVAGRFYSMDRDKNWGRVANGTIAAFSPTNELSTKIPDLIRHKFDVDYDIVNINPTAGLPVIENYSNNIDLITKTLENVAEVSYEQQNFDEYILPLHNQSPEMGIEKGHIVWLINFRSDRMKQLAKVLTEINQYYSQDLLILSNNDYGIEREILLSTPTIDTLDTGKYYPIFKTRQVQNTLAQSISEMKKTQLHIAETEKYAHVTYFLNGGVEMKYEGEDWVVIDSNKVSSHAQKPHMKAKEITDYILDHGLGMYDYIVVNYANPDMVGHTGDIEAAVESMSFLDTQIARIVDRCEADGHSMIITADHGNVEKVGEFEEDGNNLTDTEHNMSPVPCIIIQNHYSQDQLLQSIKQFTSSQQLGANITLIEDVLSENNSAELVERWLLDSEIPTPRLPLWSAGLLLLGLTE
jgi:2,3-bisphosphoglycerate-independent phosphoglycerate mutase